MSRCPHTLRGRINELLAGEAIGDLDDKECIELARLARSLPHAMPDDLMRTAALTQLALLGQETACEPLPAALKSRLENLAKEWATGNIPGIPPDLPPSPNS